MRTSQADERAPRADLPPVAEVLPQKPPMVLLDEIAEHSPETTVCRLRIGPTTPFVDAEGRVPGFVAIEYMAQCAAAHSGLGERAKGLPIRIGFLLGSRKAVFHARAFEPGQELEVAVRETWNDGELASFACTVTDRASGALQAECELAAYSPKRLADILEKQPR